MSTNKFSGISAIPGACGATSRLLRFIDTDETYGRHVISRFAKSMDDLKNVCDIGCGTGHDLNIIQRRFPEARYFGVDCHEKNKKMLAEKNIILKICNLEKDELDFQDDSMDLFLANQTYEHLKEIFWVSHQVTKKLKIGGYFLIGVPNIAAFHNRVRFIFGKQPSQMRNYSAHIRGFGPKEIPDFFNVCFPGGFELKKMAGSQFYPFPRTVARMLSSVFPRLSHSMFYLLQKKKPYNGEFIRHVEAAELETNFYTGCTQA